MKNIFIHIGREKTGTTSLQSFLSINHSKLLEYNVFYPIDKKKKYVFWDQHVGLIPSIIKNKILVLGEERNFINGEAFDEFLDDIKKVAQENILISSEFFTWIDDDNSLHFLKESLKGYNIKIIVYIRRQDEFYLSTRNELSKEGYPFEISVEDAIHFEPASHYTLINRWAKIFGKENIIVRVFDKKKLYKNDLLADFLKILDIELDSSFKRPKPLNISISLEKILLLQKLSQYLVPFTEENHKKRILHQEIRDLIVESNLFQTGEINDFFSFKDKKRILNHFEEENKLIATEYLGINTGKLFEEINSLSNVDNEYREMTNDDLVKALIKIIEQFHNNAKITEQIFYRLMIYIRDKIKLTKERTQLEYELIIKNQLLDIDFYLQTYDDVLAANIDPVMHYIEYGWYEGRNPSYYFNTTQYVMNNLEILDQNINPLVHWYMKKEE